MFSNYTNQGNKDSYFKILTNHQQFSIIFFLNTLRFILLNLKDNKLLFSSSVGILKKSIS